MRRDTWQPLIWRKGIMPSMERLPTLVRVRRDLRLAAQFSMYAAGNNDLQALLDETCRVAAEGLGVRFAKLLVYQPDEQTFVLQAGVGWRDGIVGQARFDADVSTAAGFAWRSGQAVVSNDLMSEWRFRVPDLLIEHGIVRSINVAVPGESELPFGVLEVESPEIGEFAAHDTHFLQILAQSLAAAIVRGKRQALYEVRVAQCIADYEVLLSELPHRVGSDQG